MFQGATVEARDPETRAFFKASIADFKDGKLLVEFVNGWKSEWLAPNDVRGQADPFPEEFQPRPGQEVEVLTQSENDGPYGWWEARVKSVKGDYALVQFHGWDDSYDDIVERELIRPKNLKNAIDFSLLNRIEIPLPADLKGVSSAEYFQDLREESGVCLLRVDASKNCVVVLGNSEQCKKAQMLAHLNFTHIAEIARIQQRTRNLQAKLQESMNQVKNFAVENFSVKPAVVGLIIGKKGKNIRKVQAMEGVESVKVDHENGQIRIIAKSPEIAIQARRALEYLIVDIPLEESQVGWVIGRKGRFIREIKEKSGCTLIRINRSTSNGETEFSLHLVGTKVAVESAQDLVALHIRCMGKYEEVEKEQEDIEIQVRQFSIETGIDPIPRWRGQRSRQQSTKSSNISPSTQRQSSTPRNKQDLPRERETDGDRANAAVVEANMTTSNQTQSSNQTTKRRNARKARKNGNRSSKEAKEDSSAKSGKEELSSSSSQDRSVSHSFEGTQSSQHPGAIANSLPQRPSKRKQRREMRRQKEADSDETEAESSEGRSRNIPVDLDVESSRV